MGWFREDPTHEGYLVALEAEDSNAGGSPRLRELRAPDDEATRPVRYFKAGCTCGWRSRLFHAPDGAHWHPFMLDVADDVRDAARLVWDAHHDAEGLEDYGARGLRPAEEP
jgi:hypothetical protein